MAMNQQEREKSLLKDVEAAKERAKEKESLAQHHLKQYSYEASLFNVVLANHITGMKKRLKRSCKQGWLV